MPLPPSDQQTAPTRGDLLAAIAVVATQVQTLQAALINTQASVTALHDRLTAAGLEVEPNVFSEILEAARVD